MLCRAVGVAGGGGCLPGGGGGRARPGGGFGGVFLFVGGGWWTRLWERGRVGGVVGAGAVRGPVVFSPGGGGGGCPVSVKRDSGVWGAGSVGGGWGFFSGACPRESAMLTTIPTARPGPPNPILVGRGGGGDGGGLFRIFPSRLDARTILYTLAPPTPPPSRPHYQAPTPTPPRDPPPPPSSSATPTPHTPPPLLPTHPPPPTRHPPPPPHHASPPFSQPPTIVMWICGRRFVCFMGRVGFFSRGGVGGQGGC